MLGHCKTSNFFMPVFTTQIAWEPQRIVVRQWILHDTSFHIQLNVNKLGVAELSTPFFLNIYSSVLTLSFLSLKIPDAEAKVSFVSMNGKLNSPYTTQNKKLLGIYFSGYYLQTYLQVLGTSGRGIFPLWKITKTLKKNFEVYIICCMQLMSKRINFMIFPFQMLLSFSWNFFF